jgi:hypothetical protein
MLCLFVANSTYRIGCVVDHVIQHLTKVLPFGVLLLEGWKGWSSMERPCVELCTMSPLTCEWQVDP